MFLLPAATLALLFAAIWFRFGDARRALVGALVGFQALVWIGAEGLSLFGAVGFWGIASFWLIAAVALGKVAWASRPRPSADQAQPKPASESLPFFPAAIGLLLAVNLGVAIGAAPNTSDSMTYHLPRIMHWLERGSVAHFPAHDVRLVALTPGAEYAIMHLMALTGNDRLVNMPQWFAYLGAIVVASLLARDFGAGRVGQWMAALFAATLPMAILQSTSTQNDLFVSFFCLAFLHFGIASLRREESARWLVPLCGLCIGLAVHAKGTAYFYLAPAGIAWGIAHLVRNRARALGPLAVAALMVVAPNVPHALRNQAIFGTPLVPAQFAVETERRDAGTLYSGVLRNVAIQLVTPIEEWNSGIVRWVTDRHTGAGLDPNDTATTYPGTSFELLPACADEDYAGNPLHFVLAVIAIPILLVARRNRLMSIYTLALIVSFLLLCLLLRWQPWHGRFHVYYLLLAAPLIGVAMEADRLRAVAAAAALILFAGAVPVAVANFSRPLVAREGILQVPRRQEYFRKVPDRFAEHLKLSRDIRKLGVEEIGLIVGGNEFEFPLWAMRRDPKPRMPHVYVWNQTTRLGSRNEVATVPRHIAVLGRFDLEGGRIPAEVETRVISQGEYFTLLEILGEKPKAAAAPAPDP